MLQLIVFVKFLLLLLILLMMISIPLWLVFVLVGCSHLSRLWNLRIILHRMKLICIKGIKILSLLLKISLLILMVLLSLLLSSYLSPTRFFRVGDFNFIFNNLNFFIMWAGLIMALIALAGTAYTAASNSSAIKQTNAANLQAAKETNAANKAAVESSNHTNLTIAREANANDLYKFQQQMLYNSAEAQKSRDFSERMWNMTADYNNPATQAQMMRSAGINPYNSTLDGASISVPSSSAASAPSALPSHVPDIKPLLEQMLPHQQAPLFDMSAGNFASAAQAALNFTNSSKSSAETTEILASMQSKLDKLAAETRNLDKSSSQYAENTEALRLGNQFLKATMGDNIMSTYYDMMTKQAGWKNTIADTTLKETQAWVAQHGLIFKDRELNMHQDEINKNYQIALGNLALGMKRLQFENIWHGQDFALGKYNAATQRWSAKQNVRIADNQFKELKYQNLRTFRLQLQSLNIDKAKVNILSRQLDGQMDLWKSQEFSNYVSPFVHIFGDVLGAASKLGTAKMFLK